MVFAVLTKILKILTFLMNKKHAAHFIANRLTKNQKNTLDERRTTAQPDDFIPWSKAKKITK